MRLVFMLVVLLWPVTAPAQEADKRFRLAAPQALIDSGLVGHIVPRFGLKTATRISVVEDGAEADAVFAAQGGTPVFEGLGQVWTLEVGADPDAQRFADWLGSDIGRNTVDSFEVDGTAPFTTQVRQQVAVAPLTFDGDAKRGADLSLTHCGRCHVVGAINRSKSIGSTPSFAVLRTLPNWDVRFQGFYALNPHPAFTQIADVTPPFDISRPSPIAPVELTLDELDHILAFVSGIAPANLGAPIQSR
ncbi:hypothetical protein ACOXXX_03335 [Thalassococcus sp. BH17M4-6]|uniref:hypothetical protein n=1 Tax=Thalassococcus sp. BH17M4-6 TaxID=3413148 RepID=UPI003BC9FBEC